jgi:multidrug resistance efflux pump
MTNPTIIGNASGSVMPNPAYYGFEWPELQTILDRGQALWDKRGEMGRERQALGEEKKRLEADLVKAEAGTTLASVGLGNTEIGDAGFAVDAPKAQKRLRAIEKRAGELDAKQAGLGLAIQRHKAELEKTLMVARQDGRFASEIETANAGDRAEAQDLEAQLQAIRARIQSREQLGQILGMHAGAFVA